MEWFTANQDIAGHAQYLQLSNALKQLPGKEFEVHGHPAVLLDRVTGLSTRVWGWWTSDAPALPCLLWCGEDGWSATVVEPDTLDSEGYEREFWAHRIKLLDLALANALGPYPFLVDLELSIGVAGSFGLGSRHAEITRAMRWGIVQLRAAPARSSATTGTVDTHAHSARSDGEVDAELARHALVPSLRKPAVELSRPPRPSPAADGASPHFALLSGALIHDKEPYPDDSGASRRRTSSELALDQGSGRRRR